MLWLVARKFQVVARVLLWILSIAGRQHWFDRDIATLPFPDGENMLTKTEAEKRVWKYSGADKKYTHITYTLHITTPNNSLRGAVYSVSDFGRTEKRKVKILSVPHRDLINKQFPLCWIPFCAWYRLFCCLRHLFQKQCMQWFVRHTFTSLPRLKLVTWWCVELQRWAEVELLSTTQLLNS